MTPKSVEKKMDGGLGEKRGNSTRADLEGNAHAHWPVS